MSRKDKLPTIQCKQVSRPYTKQRRRNIILKKKKNQKAWRVRNGTVCIT